MTKTRENIKIAFEGEAKAVVRLLAFAEKAEKEGIPQIAKLFRAVSMAEMVHAKKHLRNLDLVKSTEENLQASFESETTVHEVYYPDFIKQAVEDGSKAAEIAFMQSRDTEEYHARLYKNAMQNLMEERDTDYFVCTVCGHVADGKAPDNCPVCQAPKDKYMSVT